jgi:hypothetical protein
MKSLKNLNNCILTNEKIIKILNNNFYNQNIKKEKQQQNTPIKKNTQYFTPDFHDTLFWCFYIIHFSFEEYHLVSQSGFKEEQKFKMNFIKLLQNNKELLKHHKLKYINLENNIINDKNINLMSLYALLLYYKYNAFIVVDKIYYFFQNSDEEKYSCIEYKNNKFHIHYDCNLEKLQYTKDNLVKIDPLKNSLYAPSYYKVGDLVTMYKKMGCVPYDNNGKIKKKEELYNLVKDEIVKYII